MEAETFERELRKYIVENFLFGDESTELADDTSFLETGMIDSTGVLELIRYIEETCGISVSDDEIVPDNLDSIAKISRFARAKQGRS
jgi:acyl carrier protein